MIRTTFTLADIARFEGPSGNIGPLSLNVVAGTNNRQFTLSFPAQSTPGNYELEISPAIADRFGNQLDQDDDGTGGESLDDRFIGGFRFANAVARFDFGTTTSPVAAGYTGHPANHRYSAADGYGWQTGSVFGLTRTMGDNLTRDVNYTKDATFAVDLANGDYDVIVTLGDTGQPHDQMGVFLESAQVDTVTTTTGQTVARTYRVTIGDGQLNLRLFDQGGSDPWVMINGLDIVCGRRRFDRSARDVRRSRRHRHRSGGPNPTWLQRNDRFEQFYRRGRCAVGRSNGHDCSAGRQRAGNY